MSLTLSQFGIDRLDAQQRVELIGLIWDSLPDDAPYAPRLAHRRIGAANRSRRRQPRSRRALGDGAGAIVEEFMSVPVVLRPEARKDTEEAIGYFDALRPGLGQTFLIQVQEVLLRVSGMPEVHGVVWRNVRAARLRRFAYVV